jgi:CubicO group peptidase (beta-lactamase class C family)
MKRFARLVLPLLLILPAGAEPAEPMASLLPRFEQLSRQLFLETRVPGMAIGVVYQGKVVYLKGFGVRKAGTPQAVDADTVFQLASCSKPITSTALAALVGQGKLAWDDKIHKTLPQFEVADPWVSGHLTYRDMLSHHSSLPAAAGDILENLGFDRPEILRRLRYLPPAYDFRVGYAYTNYGFTVAGEAAARAAGASFEDMMDETLFKPLGMTSTSARFSDYQKAQNRSTSHSLSNGQAHPTLRMPQAQAPAGGVSSSVRDMTRWMQLHLDKGALAGKSFIPEPALAQTYRVHSLASNNPADFSGSGFYGLGWGVAYDKKGRLKLSHSGAFEIGVRTSVTLLPQEQVGIVVLSNAYPTALPEALSYSFLEMYEGRAMDIAGARQVNQAVMGVMNNMLDNGYTPPKPLKPSPALPLSDYVGDYANPYYGEAQVQLRGEALTLQLGVHPFPLRHLDRDTFLVAVPERTFEDLKSFEVQFVGDGSGTITGFRQRGLAQPDPWFGRQERASTHSSSQPIQGTN